MTNQIEKQKIKKYKCRKCNRTVNIIADGAASFQIPCPECERNSVYDNVQYMELSNDEST